MLGAPGLPKTLAEAALNTLRDGWISNDGLPELTHIRRGVMPGDPLSDIFHVTPSPGSSPRSMRTSGLPGAA